MFKKNANDRLSEWFEFRKSLDHLENPIEAVAEFWYSAPRIMHNHKIDPYNFKSWPTPWEMIVDNRYDDFSLALMIGYTLKLSNKFKDHTIQVRTMVDKSQNKLYNLVFVNDEAVLNYSNSVVNANDIDENLYLDNLVEIDQTRCVSSSTNHY